MMLLTHALCGVKYIKNIVVEIIKPHVLYLRICITISVDAFTRFGLSLADKR